MDTALPTPLIVGLWLLALLAARVAWVVIDRERARHRAAEQAREKLNDGTDSVRVGAVVVALLATAFAALATWNAADPPLDDVEMNELSLAVQSSMGQEGLEDYPSPTEDDVRDAIREAGTDPDDVEVHVAGYGWQRAATPTTLEQEGVRFQLTNEVGREPVCLQIEWYDEGEDGDRSIKVIADTAGDVC